MAEQPSSECLADTCGLCLTETCTHDCHDGMEYQFPYGWQVRIDAVARFPTQRQRDAANLHPTVKACVDGITLARGNAVGYGVIPDDSDRYLDGPHVTIGPPVKTKFGFGVLELLITDLSGEVSDA